MFGIMPLAFEDFYIFQKNGNISKHKEMVAESEI